MRHKLFAFLAVMLMPLTSFGIVFSAGNLKYTTVSDSTVLVYNTLGEKYYGDIVIPEQVTDSVNTGLTYTVIGIERYAFRNTPDLTSVVIAKTITSIPATTFENSGIVSVYIPNSITSIGLDAFKSCKNLVSVDIPNSVTEMGDDVFRGCTGLKEVKIGDGIKTITYHCFDGCTSLESIEIGNSVSTIHQYAFQNCSSLEAVRLPESLEKIRDFAFNGCSGMRTLELGTSVQEIASYAFQNCASLASVIIPASVTTVGVSAFVGNTSLKSFTVSSASTYLGNRIFALSSETSTSSGLEELISLSAIPPPVHDHAFWGIDKQKCVLRVPGAAVATYKETKYWKDFYNIVGLDDFTINDGDEYIQQKDVMGCTITYNRMFNDCNWQPLYIPFSMNYDEWADWADVAEINDVHQFFDENGDEKETVIEFCTIKNGELDPNTPYIIRAKRTGEVNVTLAGKTLYAATNGTVDCSSARRLYTLTGVYSPTTNIVGKYIIDDNGVFSPVASAEYTLQPQRFNLEITPRNGGYSQVRADNLPNRVRIAIDGNLEDKIESVAARNEGKTYYNLQGQKASERSKGIVIHNGQKILRR